ncbi:hypothetical protein ACFYKX_05185 [Cytobacillus sp. FJAT-54145]|uniref:Uncharacterized protein n=1 Tax=Cytobacillus spartinae TaxID=3299023 RepID=A0ABW6K778_9BACI
MEKWGQIREKGKNHFVLMFGIVLPIPLVIDYYILKLIFKFHFESIYLEFLVVWVICILISVAFALFGWDRMEKDWLQDKGDCM